MEQLMSNKTEVKREDLGEFEVNKVAEINDVLERFLGTSFLKSIIFGR